MLEIKDRNRKLHELYANKNFIVFMSGEEEFYKQIREIHWDWEQSGTWLKVEDIDITISLVAFEIDNGY